MTHPPLTLKNNDPISYEQYKLFFNDIKKVLKNFANFVVQNLLFCSWSP